MMNYKRKSVKDTMGRARLLTRWLVRYVNEDDPAEQGRLLGLVVDGAMHVVDRGAVPQLDDCWK